MSQQLPFMLCIAGAVAAVGFILARLLFTDDSSKLRDRLSNNQPTQVAQSGVRSPAAVPMFQKIGQAAAQPFMPKNAETQSSLRKQLAQAGVYQANAMRVVTGMKLILLVGGLLVGYLAGIWLDNQFLGLALGGLFGYLMPTFWLKSRIKKNQRSLSLALPDALDLMVVCVEAGLTVDAAMQRVGQELGLAHPALSREFGIAHMETRVGLSRQESLRNLGTRTANAALQSLAAMLIQADRFGTSIASALRIHAESLRTARQHAAEEMAAKASVKMSFPLVLFIFPATFIVLAGPTVIGLFHSALFN
jgi:tight adherence protein C